MEKEYQRAVNKNGASLSGNLPKEVVEQLGLAPGDKLTYIITESGDIKLSRASKQKGYPVIITDPEHDDQKTVKNSGDFQTVNPVYNHVNKKRFPKPIDVLNLAMNDAIADVKDDTVSAIILPTYVLKNHKLAHFQYAEADAEMAEKFNTTIGLLNDLPLGDDDYVLVSIASNIDSLTFTTFTMDRFDPLQKLFLDLEVPLTLNVPLINENAVIHEKWQNLFQELILRDKAGLTKKGFKVQIKTTDFRA